MCSGLAASVTRWQRVLPISRKLAASGSPLLHAAACLNKGDQRAGAAARFEALEVDVADDL